MTRTKTRALANWPNNAVSVLDYGAVGDGVTDDTTYIQNAINGTPVGGNLVFPPAEYRTTNYIEINKSINIDFNNSTIVSTAPGFIFLIGSEGDTANKITYTPAITKGQVTFNVAPPVGTVVGSNLYVEYGTDQYDPNEEDYSKIVQVTAVSGSSFTVDWAPDQDVNYTGNPRRNIFTRLINVAENITFRNLITRDVNQNIDGQIRTSSARNLLIENHTVAGGGICALRYTTTQNITYKNVHAPQMQVAAAGWKCNNVLIDNLYWSAKKSDLILNQPACVANESKVVNFSIRNVECYVPDAESVTKIFDFSGGSRNCSIENAQISGEFGNLTSTFDNSTEEIRLTNIQVFNNNSGFNTPSLSSGGLNNLFYDKFSPYYYEANHSSEQEVTLRLYENQGPVTFTQGVISDLHLYCTDWSKVIYLLFQNQSGTGLSTAVITDLEDNKWVRVPPSFISGFGLNGLNQDAGIKTFLLNCTPSASDFIKIRYRVDSGSASSSVLKLPPTLEELSAIQTFTPRLISSNGDLTSSPSSDSSGFFIQSGKFIYFTLNVSSLVTAATVGTGDVQVTGFPFRFAKTSWLNIASERFLNKGPVAARIYGTVGDIRDVIDLFTDIDVTGTNSWTRLPVSNIILNNQFANIVNISGCGISV